MAITLPDARGVSDEVLDALRLRALHGVEIGFSETEMADLLGVTRETVSRWWSAYADEGLEALPGGRTGRPVGSGRFLSDEQAAAIQRILDSDAVSPEDYDIASALWTRRAVQQLIRKEFGIELAVRSVGEYLKRWGYTCKRPRRHARKQDPEEVKEWLEETYPEIERKAEEEDGEIHFCDEVGVAADEHPGSGYAREGEAATMEVPKPHIRINQISTITNEGTVRFMTYEGMMNAALFLVFLDRLLRSTHRKIFLIIDSLQAHWTPDVMTWVEAHKDRIELFPLPCYSPELNADEYLNNDLKGNVNAAGLPDDKKTLRSRIQTFMRKLLHLPEHVRSYFQHPYVLYAAGS